MIHYANREGIFKGDVPPKCSCVQSSNSCTGSTIKRWESLLLGNSLRRNVIILSLLKLTKYLNSYYWETHRRVFRVIGIVKSFPGKSDYFFSVYEDFAC